MDFIVKKFNELTLDQLYKIIQLRSEIFVVEQNCVYQDLDFKDQQALHLLGLKNNKIIGYTRIFKPGDYFDNASIGRVVIDKSERKYGYGHLLMEASIKVIYKNFKTNKITISAQLYLKNFYETHGFIKLGEVYLEDGIPHIKMIKN